MDDARTTLIGEVFINAPVEKVWELWTNPQHIVKWNNTSEEWHTPHAENDLRTGGQLFLRMELKDGRDGFDYRCTYEEVIINEKIAHTGSDNRKTTVVFTAHKRGTKLTEVFEAENKTPMEVQEAFCQSILDHFKTYVENTPQ